MARLNFDSRSSPRRWRFLDDLDVARATKTKSTKIRELESCRQWLLDELLLRYGYPEELVGRRILPVGPHAALHPKDDCLGFVMISTRGSPYLWAIVGEQSDQSDLEDRLRALLQGEPFASVGICTDGTETGTVILRRRFDRAQCDYATDVPEYWGLRGPNSTLSSAAQSKLQDDAEAVFFQCHSHIRDTDGMHADEALDELCKLIHLKCKLEVQDQDLAAFHASTYLNVDDFGASLRSLYSWSAAPADANAREDRGVYKAPLRLSNGAIARVAEELSSFNLTKSSIDIKGRAFQRVLLPTIRSGMGQYFTPDPVVQLIVEATSPTANTRILDPFAGSGHFLTRSLGHICTDSKGTAEARRAIARNCLFGIEKSERMVRIAKTDMLLQGDGHTNLLCWDSLLAFSNYASIGWSDFDVVMTNPPFGSILSHESLSQLGAFELASRTKRTPLEVLGLERSVEFLRPGGLLAIVLPDGVLVNRQTKYVREWMLTKVRILAVVSLPVQTFAPFGANIRTSIVIAKKLKGRESARKSRVALVRLDEIGYDATGRFSDKTDVSAAIEELRPVVLQEMR